MMSIRGFATKKALRTAIKDHGAIPTSRLIETSMFGVEGVVGKHVIVGPSPTERRWYAEIEIAERDDALMIVSAK